MDKSDLAIKLLKVIENLKVVQYITGCPAGALAAIWMHKSGGKLTTVSPDGPFGIDSSFWDEQRVREALEKFNRLSNRDVATLVKKPVKSFILGAFLAAVDLQKSTEVTLYPDMDKRVVQSLLAASHGVPESLTEDIYTCLSQLPVRS